MLTLIPVVIAGAAYGAACWERTMRKPRKEDVKRLQAAKEAKLIADKERADAEIARAKAEEEAAKLSTETCKGDES